MRKSKIERKTTETDIKLSLNIDGSGQQNINTGVGFFDHMLQLMTKHGLFDLDVQCNGDIHVDFHHTVEDIGIVLGKAFNEAMGEKIGIARYQTEFTPMDESLSVVSIDISGRAYLVFNVKYNNEKVGDFDTELVEEFFRAFVNYAKITLHINLYYGSNTHHIIESIFKGFGRAMRKSLSIDKNIQGVMSTKGVIE